MLECIQAKEVRYPLDIRTKNPRGADSWVFLFRFWRGGLDLRLVATMISIEPFANIVGHYACRKRNHERGQNLHWYTPPFRAGIGGWQPMLCIDMACENTRFI